MAHMRDARVYNARTGTRAYRAHARELRSQIFTQCVKWFLYAVCAVLLCLAEQTSFAFWGNKTTVVPYLLPAWVALISMYEGWIGGAWFGMFVGLLSDAAGGTSVYLMPMVFMLYGLSVGRLSMRFLRKGFPVWLLYDAAVSAVHALVRLAGVGISALLYEDILPPAAALFHGAAWEACAAAVWALPLYLPAKGIIRLTSGRRKPDAIGSPEE